MKFEITFRFEDVNSVDVVEVNKLLDEIRNFLLDLNFIKPEDVKDGRKIPTVLQKQ